LPATLVQRRILDPRPADLASAEPLADAVNIPLVELPQRTHELPPRDEVVRVGGPRDLAERTADWLARHGREAAVAPAVPEPRAGEPGTIGRLWRPNAWLDEVANELTPRAALDLACGSGREAVFLAARGWSVVAVDVLPDALERARDLARRYAPHAQPIQWVEADLERATPGYGREFDLIVGFRFLHRPLFERFAQWLRPGGSVVWETFTTMHRDKHAKPLRDEYVLRAGELPKLLSGYEIRSYSESWRGDAHTARVWASLGASQP
jgi:SAM-dependent methyltransferase